MQHNEVVKLVQLVSAGWQNFRPGDIQQTIAFWEDVIGEYEFMDAALAVKTFAASNADGFPPGPGQIIQTMQKIRSAGAGQLTDNEAWNLVRNALSNSTYNAAVEFGKLPELVQRAVGSASQLQSWATDEEFNESVISSQFLKCYRAELNRAMEEDRFPESVKALINATRQQQAGLAEAKQAMIAAGIEFDVLIEDPEPLPVRTDEDGYEYLNLDEYRRQREARAAEEKTTDAKLVEDLVKHAKEALANG